MEHCEGWAATLTMPECQVEKINPDTSLQSKCVADWPRLLQRMKPGSERALGKPRDSRPSRVPSECAYQNTMVVVMPE